jgi:hypothetical protein
MHRVLQVHEHPAQGEIQGKVANVLENNTCKNCLSLCGNMVKGKRSVQMITTMACWDTFSRTYTSSSLVAILKARSSQMAAVFKAAILNASHLKGAISNGSHLKDHEPMHTRAGYNLL